MRRLFALRHHVLPVAALQAMGVVLLVLALAAPWLMLARRARWHQPRVPAPAAVRPAMIVLPPGTFTREGQSVRITRRFALAETEVTQEHYQRVMGQNPSGFSGGGDLPVENVSWLDAVTYCNRLSKMEQREPCYDIQGETVTWPKGLDCPGYRIPTEAEWEYAARADQNTKYSGSDQLDEVGWYTGNSDRRTQLVASKKPNAWGLYDLSGNVWEWNWDGFADYPEGPSKDPTGDMNSHYRVQRGGPWSNNALDARVAQRNFDSSGQRSRYVGFRIARSIPPSP